VSFNLSAERVLFEAIGYARNRILLVETLFADATANLSRYAEAD
jgi:hypothetical protein